MVAVDPLDAAFLEIISDRTAGDPMQAGVRWTNLSARQIAKRLAAAGFAVGRRAVRRLLRRHRYGRRPFGSAQGELAQERAMRYRPGRDAQFVNVARPKAEYLAAGDPVVGIDTKKRELIGDFLRPGTGDGLRGRAG